MAITETVEEYQNRNGQITNEKYFPDQYQQPDFPARPKGKLMFPLENGCRQIPKYPAGWDKMIQIKNKKDQDNSSFFRDREIRNFDASIHFAQKEEEYKLMEDDEDDFEFRCDKFRDEL